MASPLSPATATQTSDCRLPATRSTNPYLFIVGCPRSGTTMLKRMVNAHPSVAITRETHWIARYFEKKKGIDDEGRVTEEIVDKLFEHHRFDQMKIRRERLLDFVRGRANLTYAELVSHIFDHYGRRKKKPLVGDKTPTYVRKLPTLNALWPEAKIVHLIRDGRDVWLSIKQWRMAAKSAGKFGTWSVDPLVTTALWWKALVGMGRRDGTSIGPQQVHEMKYESLVAQPESECRRLTHFLRLSYVEAMAHYYTGRTRSEQQLSTNAAWLPPTPGRRDWRSQMKTDEIERFEAVAGDLLEELGYERACPKISPEVRRDVDDLKQAFAKEVAGRWRLPEPW